MPRRKLPKSNRRSAARSVAPSKRSRKVSSRRRKPSSSRSTRSGNWAQAFIAWVVIAAVGIAVSWYVAVWGIGPAFLKTVLANKTIAYVPSQAEGSIVIVHFGSELKRSSAFLVDGEQKVNLPGKYGEYKLNAVYPLLQMEQKDERYLIGSMNRVTGVFLSEVVNTSEALDVDRAHDASELHQLFWDRLMNGRVELPLLGAWYVLKNEALVTKTDSVKDVAKMLEKEMGGTFGARDECSIAILNSTNIPGLAGRLSDIVEGNGGVVIRLGQYSETLENSQILYDPTRAECSVALEQIKTLSPVPFEIQEDTTVLNAFRAPIVAIIGENFE